MKNINSIEIQSAKAIAGQLFIVCEVLLDDGQVVPYTSCNEIEFLESLRDIGGTSSHELKKAIGDDYLNDAAEHLITAASKKWGKLEALLRECSV